MRPIDFFVPVMHLHAHVVLQNNALWGVQTISDNGQAALRWFQIDGDIINVIGQIL